jgi:hypothetical protein
LVLVPVFFVELHRGSQAIFGMHSVRLLLRSRRPLFRAVQAVLSDEASMNNSKLAALRSQSSSSVAQTISVKHQIDHRRSQSRLGGGEKRINAQHKKVSILHNV